MPRTIIGVMGPGDPKDLELISLARQMGRAVAESGWVLLTGGRAAGVMEAASQGASQAGGLVVGILPDSDKSKASQFVDIAIPSGMGSARNNINVLASDVVVAIGMGAGTASELALALKAGKEVVLLAAGESAGQFFGGLGAESVRMAESPGEATGIIKSILEKRVNK